MAQTDDKHLPSGDDRRSMPYFSGSGLACVGMVVSFFGLGSHSEDELVQRLDTSGLPPEEFGLLGMMPDVHVSLLQTYGVSCRLRTDGQVSRLQESLSHGRAVIVFLGEKAYRRRRFGVWLPVGVADAGYHPVVVTEVRPSAIPGGSQVVFHDPDPQRGGESRSLRKGNHTVWSGGHGFEHAWGVWQGWMPILGYLTLKMPDLQPARRLAPWVFVEAWGPTQ